MNIRKTAALLCAAAAAAGIMSSCAEENINAAEAQTSAYVSNETVGTAALVQTEKAASDNKAGKTSSSSKKSEDPKPDYDKTQFTFTYKSGFYDKSFNLEINCPFKDAKVYYTTDGSVPTKSSDLYTGPLEMKNRRSDKNVLSAVKGTSAGNNYLPTSRVDKANVIRAVAYLPDGKKSEVITGTFFVGINREKKYGKVPVISLVTDQKNLFDYEKGIYVMGKTYDDWIAEDPSRAYMNDWEKVGNYSNKGREWERPVSVEYFTSGGKSAFVQDMGMRIKGGASRGSTQKSMTITARSDYGKKSVKYEIIPGNIRSDGKGKVSKYKSFVFRNGGNDSEGSKLRDPLFQELISDRRMETQQYTPCVVYLDGEYWGMYTLCEDYSDNYIENNYGIQNDNVVVVKKGEIEDGKDEDIKLYEKMYDYIVNNNMKDPAKYAEASKMLDMGSFADYCAFNLYIYNEDSIFKSNNWEMWRVRTPDKKIPEADGKWRMMVFDTEYAAGIYCGGDNYKTDNLSAVLKRDPSYISWNNEYDINEAKEERHPTELFLSLYENKDFKKELVNSLCDIRNINFESESSRTRLAELSEVYGKIVPDTYKRFGPEWLVWQDQNFFNYKVNEIAVFLDGRYEKFPDIMKKAMGLKDKAKLSLSVSDGKKGSVLINSSGTKINGSFKGYYFPDYEIKLTAVPEKGKKFVRWECSGCTVSNKTSSEVTVKFSGDFTVKAVFE